MYHHIPTSGGGGHVSLPLQKAPELMCEPCFPVSNEGCRPAWTGGGRRRLGGAPQSDIHAPWRSARSATLRCGCSAAATDPCPPQAVRAVPARGAPVPQPAAVEPRCRPRRCAQAPLRLPSRGGKAVSRTAGLPPLPPGAGGEGGARGTDVRGPRCPGAERGRPSPWRRVAGSCFSHCSN